MSEKWRNLWLLTVGELLAMALWFSASAVVPQLTLEWQLSGSQQSWLTMSVQAGFVVGAVISAALNLADRIPPQYLIAASTLAAAGCNAAIAQFADSPDMAMVLRVLTGVCLAGVYPPGMKLVASWSTRDRGLGIGLLVGALTIGSASPHLINALPILGGEAGMPPWRSVLLLASAAAVLGAVMVAAFVKPEPGAQQFDVACASVETLQCKSQSSPNRLLSGVTFFNCCCECMYLAGDLTRRRALKVTAYTLGLVADQNAIPVCTRMTPVRFGRGTAHTTVPYRF